MKLSECCLGVIVRETKPIAMTRDGVQRIGHITGLRLNSCETPEVIPIVQWAGRRDSEPSIFPMHHNNIELFVD
jgi:hypothetical protein